MSDEFAPTDWGTGGESQSLLTVELEGGGTMVIAAQQVGSVPVADLGVITKLSDITSAIQRVSSDVLSAVRNAGPSKATVELGFGLAIGTNGIMALFGQAKSEAAIKVTLEWSRDNAPARTGS